MKLSAIVIHINERVRDVGDLLATGRDEAKNRHGLKNDNVEVKEIFHVPSLGVYVALLALAS